ncbi:DUF4974 domain-containing protein [Niabella sp. W65]|nr:DUF4974 domain-containing protein [Niabella sp. W65]MCH7364090.1 DUF4974 domain-containing protein [Niabella sp. W65]ULT39967.1 DUF4974 domain-containing protein [Niabella sp. I65]
MTQMERWYDIETMYPAKLGERKFYAEISRDKKLSQVLTVLERSGGLSFKIEGRKVYIHSQ